MLGLNSWECVSVAAVSVSLSHWTQCAQPSTLLRNWKWRKGSSGVLGRIRSYCSTDFLIVLVNGPARMPFLWIRTMALQATTGQALHCVSASFRSLWLQIMNRRRFVADLNLYYSIQADCPQLSVHYRNIDCTICIAALCYSHSWLNLDLKVALRRWILE